ncbi:hypothetical protein N9N03_00470 [Chlamydiia bacterium]|nr:hypothetical protein [Chlamydiia bacterium]
MNKLFLITLLTFSAVWAIDTGTAGSNGTVSVQGGNAQFSYSGARDTVDLKINPMVAIDSLTSSSGMEFAAPGAANSKATTITLSTTSNTALSVTFGAAHAAGTTSDVVLTFTNDSSKGDGAFSGASESDPSNASPDLNAVATKAIAFGEAQQVTGVTLTGVYGANKPENTGDHTITVTATVTDGGDA